VVTTSEVVPLRTRAIRRLAAPRGGA